MDSIKFEQTFGYDKEVDSVSPNARQRELSSDSAAVATVGSLLTRGVPVAFGWGISGGILGVLLETVLYGKEVDGFSLLKSLT